MAWTWSGPCTTRGSKLAKLYAYQNKLNRIVVPTPDAWLGIMTTGKTYYDVRQALVELGLNDEELRRHGIRILKMGMLFPMEPRVVREFAQGLEEILVVEEKRSFIEMFAKDTLYAMPDRPRIVGKRDEEDRLLVPIVGELDPDTIAHAIAKRIARKMRVDSVEARIRHIDELKHRPKSLSLARSAYFCSGCPTTGRRWCPRVEWPPRASAVTAWPWAWTAASSGHPWAPRARSGWAFPCSRRRRTSSRTSATARSSTRAASPSTTPSRPASTSRTRFSTTPRWP
jgi:hypothetical protein